MSIDAPIEPLISGHVLKQRYRILVQIGAGGYGDVYKAADAQFGDRPVAVKEMVQRGMTPEEIEVAAEGFKKEALLLASLTHQNLPSIYDYFAEDGRWYLVMSYIEGTTLEVYLQRNKEGRLPADKVIQIGIQLASALNYLHTRKPPVVFRDLKPANVMRTHDGQIYLIDFGIARHFKQGQVRDTLVLGSPGYAAPEQYGQTQTTPQSDVYTFGVTLHQLLTGDDPTLRPFRYAPLEIPEYPQLANLVTCMLDKDVKKRPASMGNIQRELQRIVMGRSPYPREAGLSTRRVPAVHIEHSVSPEQEVVVPPRVPMLPGSLAAAQLSVAWLPDGENLLVARGQNSVQCIDASTQNVIRTYITSPGVSITALSLAPMGKYLALACTDGTVRMLDLTSGLQFSPYPAHSYPVCCVAWSPDARYIASADEHHALHIWKSFSRSTIRIYRHHLIRITSLAWSPDSFYMISGGYDGIARLWQIHSGDDLFYFPSDPVQAVSWSPDGRFVAVGFHKSVQVWSVSTGQPLYRHSGHKGQVTALNWSPDSMRVASASYDHTVQIWEVRTGHVTDQYTQHQEPVLVVSWSPDGKRVVSGDASGRVNIWQPDARP